jgi:PHP family Zn ribbon phosphoesterase
MTPNNIVNMAFVKGLDIIAITDHNACNHVRIANELAEALGILLIPGMEVQTREEVHILCYFPTVDAIECFDVQLSPLKSKIRNRIDVFGHQTILDINDALVCEYEDALIMSVDISLEALKSLVESFGGIMVPAHVNKSANSILVNLGFIPTDLNIKCVEIHEKSPINEIFIRNYQRIYNSDAHYLENLSEPIHFIELGEKTRIALIDYLTGKG